MTVGNRSLITKGIFAVGVIAVTAIAGSVGFARAQQGQAFSDGYSGAGMSVRAALARFESAVTASQTKYRNDVNACLTQHTAATSNRDAFNRRNTDAVNQLRSFAANPARVNENDQQLDRSLAAQELQTRVSLTSNVNQMVAGLNQARQVQNLQSLQQCLRTAAASFQSSLQSAHQTLIQALRDILHRRS